MIAKPHANLIRTTKENNLVHIIIKQSEASLEGKPIEKEFKNICSLLRETCDNKFTQFEFINERQQVLDEYMIYRIVQVWQIFDQYFKQFYYLENYYTIKSTC